MLNEMVEIKSLPFCLSWRRKSSKTEEGFCLFVFSALITPFRGPAMQQAISKSLLCCPLCLSPATKSACETACESPSVVHSPLDLSGVDCSPHWAVAGSWRHAFMCHVTSAALPCPSPDSSPQSLVSLFRARTLTPQRWASHCGH